MRTALLIWLLFTGGKAFAWGFFAHRKINEHAVYALPKPLFGFYKLHLDYLTAHATDADNRRYVADDEACRHYLDGDRYECAAPFDTLPHTYKQAVALYTEDTLKAHGIVPWHIQAMLYRLTEAFRERHADRILKLSADLGHYVGDLHVPLHATSNYNGQKTGQHGIHALWESRLPELFFEDYVMLTGQAVYLETGSELIWKAMGESFALKDSVLGSERRVSAGFPDALKYSWEMRGQTPVKVYARPFCEAYHRETGQLIQDRMRASVYLLACLWYSCWINAGQPDLKGLPAPETPETPAEQPEKGSMKGRGED